ncbi:2-amino-4-hydroxy-6-hydroxymethyldihydropteridine diphosphokinase [Kineococcus sp. NBC_00420]|uniref:2-amino-4-hydroxy-6- hydroxymethyldihydropteridine diphosphokinase n=1 Tax=Kineococcus sp. NBC_00420 TaxID=2903564 RepID=UPI002E1CA7AB
MNAVLSLGANTGHRAANLHAALEALSAVEGITVDAVSTFVESTPVGTVQDQPDFLNAVALVSTTLDPHALLRACHAVEAEVGLDRSTKVPDGPRPIDVDVVTCDGLVLIEDGLVLPHPRAHERTFVLGPWLELDPDAELPGPHGGRVETLLQAIS